MKSKKLLTVGLGIASVLILAACGNEEKNDNKTDTTTTDTTKSNTSTNQQNTLDESILFNVSNLVYGLPPVEKLKDNSYFGLTVKYDESKITEVKQHLTYLKGLKDKQLTKDEVKTKNAMIELLTLQNTIYELLNTNLNEDKTFKQDESFYKEYERLRENVYKLFTEHINTLASLYLIQYDESLTKEDTQAYIDFIHAVTINSSVNNTYTSPTDGTIIDYVNNLTIGSLMNGLYNELGMLVIIPEEKNNTMIYLNKLLSELDTIQKSELYQQNKFYKEYIDQFHYEKLNKLVTLIERKDLDGIQVLNNELFTPYYNYTDSKFKGEEYSSLRLVLDSVYVIQHDTLDDGYVEVNTGIEINAQ